MTFALKINCGPLQINVDTCWLGLLRALRLQKQLIRNAEGGSRLSPRGDPWEGGGRRLQHGWSNPRSFFFPVARAQLLLRLRLFMRAAAAAKQKRISLLINLLGFSLAHFALAEDRNLSTCLYLWLYPGSGHNNFATQPAHHVAAICSLGFHKGMLNSVCQGFPFSRRCLAWLGQCCNSFTI